MTDSTLATGSVGFDTTVASTATPAAAPAAKALLASTLTRSTVLPRVEMVGAEPRLVVEGKPRYQHTRRLGEGGLGEVLGARDNDIGRDVAVKRLKPEVTSHASLARFVEEVRTIGRLEHPNIIPIHDVGVDEHGDYYFVMKYVDGETLESIIEKLAAGDPLYHARYGFERRVQIFMGLLEAVAFAHEKGIVHRDIKPANVMVGQYGEVVLMDWGIAKQVRGATPSLADAAFDAPAVHAGARGALFETQAGQLVGTPAYMSPEQARGESVDERSDIYSLSLLLHELLCLRHPLAEKQTLAEMLHGVTSEPVPMAGFVSSSHQPTVPMDLSWYIHKGLAKDPTSRYQSVAEMVERLLNRAEGKIPIQCHITFVKRVNGEWNRFVDRHPFVVTIALAVMVLAFVAGGVSAVAHRIG
ncbi:MAG: serine/threonine-protein kinase [Polyangiaceae bacterium]